MNVDLALFHWINGTLGWEGLEPIMKAISNFRLFIPAVAIAAIWMLARDGRRGRITVLVLALTVPASDLVSSRLLKPAIGRPRPCRPESGLVDVRTHDVHCSGKGSFPSSHAANTAAAGIVLAMQYPHVWVPAGVVLVLVGWSRVYLGVHYPTDILGGWVVGGILGILGLLLVRRVAGRLARSRIRGPGA